MEYKLNQFKILIVGVFIFANTLMYSNPAITGPAVITLGQDKYYFYVGNDDKLSYKTIPLRGGSTSDVHKIYSGAEDITPIAISEPNASRFYVFYVKDDHNEFRIYRFELTNTGLKKTKLTTNVKNVKSFGVAPSTNGVFVTFLTDDKTSKFSYYSLSWESLQKDDEKSPNVTEVSTSESMKSISCTSIISSDSPRALIVGAVSSDRKTGYFYEFPLSDDNKIGTKAHKSSIEDSDGFTSSLVLHLGADGRAYAQGNLENDRITMWQRNTNKTWSKIKKITDDDRKKSYPPCVVYYSGENEESGNGVFKRKDVKLYREIWYTVDGGNFHLVKEYFGIAQRMPLPINTSESAVLLGIIEGAPPIPAINMNAIPSTSSHPSTSYVSFSVSRTQQSGLQASWSAGGAAKGTYKQKIIIVDLQASAEIGLGYKGLYNSINGSVSNIELKVSMEKTTVDGKIYPQPIGTAIFLKMNWSGYAFQFIPPGASKPSPDTPILYQISPIDTAIITTPYYINPQDFTPGSLETYFDRYDKLSSQPHYTFYDVSGNPSNSMINSWSSGATSTVAYNTYNEQSLTNGFFVNASVMVGGGLDLGGGVLVKESAEISLGVNVATEMSWTSTNKSSRGLSFSVNPRSDPSVPDTYIRYSTYLFHLKESSKINEAFKEGLIWGNMNSTSKSTNSNVKKMVYSDSIPWKISYSVADAVTSTKK